MGLLILAILVTLAIALAALWARSAYTRGVLDGYGYAREPWREEYRQAGEVIECLRRGLEFADNQPANSACGEALNSPTPRIVSVAAPAEDCDRCSECLQDGCPKDCSCWCHGRQEEVEEISETFP